MYLTTSQSPKTKASTTFHEIAKLLCKFLDTSTSHEYANILPKLGNAL